MIASKTPSLPLPIVIFGPPLMIGFGVALNHFSRRFASPDVIHIEALLRGTIDEAASETR